MPCQRRRSPLLTLLALGAVVGCSDAQCPEHQARLTITVHEVENDYNDGTFGGQGDFLVQLGRVGAAYTFETSVETANAAHRAVWQGLPPWDAGCFDVDPIDSGSLVPVRFRLRDQDLFCCMTTVDEGLLMVQTYLPGNGPIWQHIQDSDTRNDLETRLRYTHAWSELPSTTPTAAPSASTTRPTTVTPTPAPTGAPGSTAPTGSPSAAPNMSPSGSPTAPPTVSPTAPPTVSPTAPPTGLPSLGPTTVPPGTGGTGRTGDGSAAIAGRDDGEDGRDDGGGGAAIGAVVAIAIVVFVAGVAVLVHRDRRAKVSGPHAKGAAAPGMPPAVPPFRAAHPLEQASSTDGDNEMLGMNDNPVYYAGAADENGGAMYEDPDGVNILASYRPAAAKNDRYKRLQGTYETGITLASDSATGRYARLTLRINTPDVGSGSGIHDSSMHGPPGSGSSGGGSGSGPSDSPAAGGPIFAYEAMEGPSVGTKPVEPVAPLPVYHAQTATASEHSNQVTRQPDGPASQSPAPVYHVTQHSADYLPGVHPSTPGAGQRHGQSDDSSDDSSMYASPTAVSGAVASGAESSGDGPSAESSCDGGGPIAGLEPVPPDVPADPTVPGQYKTLDLETGCGRGEVGEGPPPGLPLPYDTLTVRGTSIDEPVESVGSVGAVVPQHGGDANADTVEFAPPSEDIYDEPSLTGRRAAAPKDESPQDESPPALDRAQKPKNDRKETPQRVAVDATAATVA